MEQLKIKRDQQLGLMQALEFRDKDLEANRSGVLSDPQRRRLRLMQIRDTLVHLVFATSYILLSIYLPPPPQKDSWKSRPELMPLIGLCFLVGALWELFKAQKILDNNRVESISGPLKHRTDRGKGGVQNPKLVIAEKAFAVSDEGSMWFDEGKNYTLYYVPATKQLLSAEPTDDSKQEIHMGEPDAEVIVKPLNALLFDDLVRKIKDDETWSN